MLDTIGVTPVRNEDVSLTGAGVRAAQPEASESPSHWQVNPAVVSQPVSLFTWTSSDGSSTTYPNSLGQESGHEHQRAGAQNPEVDAESSLPTTGQCARCQAPQDHSETGSGHRQPQRGIQIDRPVVGPGQTIQRHDGEGA